MSLKPDLFEGLRFDLTKPLNHNFALSHSIFMGNIDVPTANNQARSYVAEDGCLLCCWAGALLGHPRASLVPTCPNAAVLAHFFAH